MEQILLRKLTGLGFFLPPWDRLQPEDFLGQPLDNRSVGWRLEGLNGWDDGWGPGEPGRRRNRPADTVHDPGGDGGHGGRGEQHHHGLALFLAMH